MNKLSKLIKRLLVIARAPDTKYLIGLNLQAIQKIRGKPGPNDNPREFYQALQQEATKGPIFNEQTLKFMDKLDLDLTKDEVKWIATRYQKKAKIKIDELRNVLDYIRSEKPDLSKLSYQKAVQNSIAWHEQFKGKEETAGPYKTKNVILKLTNGYTWVEVPAEDLETEGDNMGHCVGGEDYVKKVKAGRVKILSLRDNGNKPHVTVELTKVGDVVQVQGKQNEEPVAKYHTYIEQLWNHLKIEHNEHTAKYITDPELLRRMSSHPDSALHVASNPKLPEDIIRLLFNKATEEGPLLRNLALNPKLPVDIMQAYLKKNKTKEYVRYLACNPGLPLELMEGLSRNKDAGIRSNLASNPKLPPKLMEVLAKDRTSIVRFHLAKQPNLPEEVILDLLKDEHSTVRSTLLSNQKLPADMMRNLAKDKNANIRRDLAANKNLPIEVMCLLAKDTDQTVVDTLINYNFDPPVEVLEALAESPLGHARSLAAEDPRIKLETMQRLVKDTAPEVLECLAGNPSLDEASMEVLVKSKDVSVRISLAKNPKLPTKLIRLLEKDKNPNVVRALLLAIKRNKT
jgi:hypothetical protein